jgi:sugar/nucleoside kinase (ribokinase family)
MMVVFQSNGYVAIGHVTHDVLADESYAVGGTVSYAALTAAALGRSAAVLTSAESGFDFSIFKDSVAVQCNCASHTTTFHNLYTNGTRHQRVYSVASPLVPELVPSSWRSAHTVHVGPVMGECDPALVHTFSSDTFIGITAQGWMRERNGTGNVVPRPWQPSDDVLERASAVVFSIDDIQGEWQVAEKLAARTRILAVTMGPRGGVLFVDGTAYPFAALRVTEVDPTGAGDIFAAVFFSKVAAGVAPSLAARYSACVASRSVERRGIAGVPGAADLVYCDGLFSA